MSDPPSTTEKIEPFLEVVRIGMMRIGGEPFTGEVTVRFQVSRGGLSSWQFIPVFSGQNKTKHEEDVLRVKNLDDKLK